MACSPLRRSTRTKATLSPAPAAVMATALGVHPRGPEPIVNPQVKAPRPKVASPAPAASSGAGWSLRGSLTNSQARTTAPAASGRLTRKIARQPTRSISQPPSTGPMAPAMALAAAQTPIARPRATPSKRRRGWPGCWACSMAAPTPWITPREQQQRQAGRQRAAGRGEREHQRSRPTSSRPRPNRSPRRAAEQQKRAERQQIGVDHPGQFACRRAQAEADRRQPDIDHRAVDEGEAGGEDRGDQHQARVGAAPLRPRRGARDVAACEDEAHRRKNLSRREREGPRAKRMGG